MINPQSDQTNFVEFSLERWRDRFLRVVLYVTSGIGLIGIIAYIFTSHTPLFTWIAIGCYLVLLAFTFVPMGYFPRAGFFMTLLDLLCIFTLLDTGIQNTAILFILGTTILSALIYTPRSAVINAAGSLVVIAVVGWLVLTGRFTLFSGPEYAGTLAEWIQTGAYYLLLVTLILSGIRLLKLDFLKAEEQANLLLGSLKTEQLHLADRVAAATRNLTLAAEVGQTISQVHDLDLLLKDAVDLIRDRFDLYYAQVYLLDPTGRQLVLRSGTGDVGQQLRNRRHTLSADMSSLNGLACMDRKPVVVEDTAQNPIHRPNPLLPNTRSEMVIPLLARDRVVGTLDMQSTQADALNQSNLEAFQVLAGQLAVAVENATLLTETEAARRTVEAQSRRLIRSGWQDFLTAINHQERIGFNYDLEKMSPLSEPVEARPDEHSLILPIEVVGEPVGLFKFEKETGWSEADAALETQVSRQLGQHVENLRLLDQAERYRTEAEEALGRLTRQGWEKELAVHPQAETGYQYDMSAVSIIKESSSLEIAPTLTHPLEIFGEKIGEISVLHGQPGAQETDDLVSKVGEQLSARVENLRLFYETQRSQVEVEKRARQLAAVAAISTFSSQELDIDRMLASAVHLTQRQFSLLHAHVYLFDEKTGEMKTAACGWKEGDAHEGAHSDSVVPLSDQVSLVARAARLRQPVILDDLHSQPGFQSGLFLEEAVSAMAVPLLTGDKLLGVLEVFSDQPNAFTQEDANIHTTLAAQVAISLQNARSFIQAQKEAERETLLNAIGQKIRAATSVEAVLQIAARELGHALGAPLTIAQLSMKDRQVQE